MKIDAPRMGKQGISPRRADWQVDRWRVLWNWSNGCSNRGSRKEQGESFVAWQRVLIENSAMWLSVAPGRLTNPEICPEQLYNVYCKCTFSPYRAVNTLRLSYTNQSVNVVQGNNRCLFWDPHKTHKYSCVGQNVELLNVKLAVHIVTTGL